MKRADVRHFRLSPELADPYVDLEKISKSSFGALCCARTPGGIANAST
jgi:hypothetical protein